MPELDKRPAENKETTVSPVELAALIERMDFVIKGEAKMVRLLEEDVVVDERLARWLIDPKPCG